MKAIALFRHVVLQPTTLCNLNCRYCYLPDRLKSRRMSKEITNAVAKSIEVLNYPISVVWHGGEPLATGIGKLRELLESFRAMRIKGKVRHSIQTNGTLISQEWCDLLKEEGFGVGVSLDGDETQNAGRVTWTNTSSFARVMKGIELLKRNDISFGVIAVVNPRNVGDPSFFYKFFVALGCSILNVNIEEREGLNRSNPDLGKDEVKRFWEGLFEAWRENPVLKIREFDMALGWINSVTSLSDEGVRLYTRDFWPTVAWNGDLVVLSPELVSANENERGQFVVGNVLETPLYELVHYARNAWYVKEFFRGVKQCRESCEYYEFCGGGQASNKYFELGNIAGTETAQCRNTRQFVVDAILESLPRKVSAQHTERR